MTTTARFWRFLAAAAFFAAVRPGVAQDVNPADLKPQLADTDFFFKGGMAAPDGVVPAPDWSAEARGDVAALSMGQKLRSLPGQKMYDTNVPPMSLHWWNYPIYAALGFPRDLVDALFGTMGNAPFLFNIPTTGAMYELVPSQILMRPYSDWHRWPGRINAKGHGWLDGTWGWFPNLHATTFRSVNERKLAVWEAHNRDMRAQLEQANGRTDETNKAVADRRAAYLSETGKLLAAGKRRIAVSRLMAYREAAPLDPDARGMLVAALASLLSDVPERAWAEQTLADVVWGSSRSALPPAREELRKLLAREGNENAARYLVAVNMRLLNYAQAMEAAKELVALNPADLSARRLQFEAALAGRDEETIEAAAREIESKAGANSPAALDARARQALAADDWSVAEGILTHAIGIEPKNPRFHYLRAMAMVGEARKSREYNKSAVCRDLSDAEAFARSTGEQEFYRRSLDAAKALSLRPASVNAPLPDEQKQSHRHKSHKKSKKKKKGLR